MPDRRVAIARRPAAVHRHLWMMTAGAWQVRVAVDGDRGAGQLAVPVPTLPQVDARDEPDARARSSPA